MEALNLSIQTRHLMKRMRERLTGGQAIARQVVWNQPDGQSLLIFRDSLEVRTVGGFLLCNLDVATDQTGRQQLQFIFFLGTAEEGGGQQASATINAPTLQAAQLAAGWGTELQRVLWDGILDAIEACVHRATLDHRDEPLTLQGFHATSDVINVNVLVGEF